MKRVIPAGWVDAHVRRRRPGGVRKGLCVVFLIGGVVESFGRHECTTGGGRRWRVGKRMTGVWSRRGGKGREDGFEKETKVGKFCGGVFAERDVTNGDGASLRGCGNV